MAGPILSILGGVVAGPIGAFIGLMAGKWIDANLVWGGMDNVRQEGPRLDSLQVQTSSYGAPIQRLYGTMRLAGNVIWAQPIREERLTDEISGGCFGPDTDIIEYVYYGTFAVGLCKGPIDGVLRIWADTKLIYDNSTTNRDVVRIPGLSYTLYLGDETQTADTLMESFEGVGNVPGHRGLAYLVFDDLPLAEFGNRIPNLTFEISTNITEHHPYDKLTALSFATSNEDDFRVDPATSLYAVLHTTGLWTRIELVEGAIQLQLDNGDIGTLNSGWDYDSHLYIFASGPGGASAKYALHKLSSRSFTPSAIGDDVDVPLKQVTYGDRQGLVSSTTATIYALSASGTATFFQFEIFSQGPEFEYTLPAEGRMIASRVEGVTAFAVKYAYVICSISGSPGTTYIVRVRGSAVQQYNISAYVQYGELICYDAVTNQVIVGSTETGDVSFFDADTMSHLATITNIVSGLHASEFKQGPVDGFLWLAEQTTLRKVNVATHTVDASYTLALSKTAGGFYDKVMHSFWYGSSLAGGFVRLYLDRKMGGGAALSDVVTDICGQLGLSPSEIDVSALTGETVKGFCIDNRMTGRAALEALMAAYLFDACESDGKVKFPKRLGSSIMSIPETELGAHIFGSERPQTLTKVRTEIAEVPKVVEIEYLDALLIHYRVVKVELTIPPGSPAVGSIYQVGSGATGAWSGHDDELATWTGSVWTFMVPMEGWRIFAEDRLSYFVFDGSAWNPNSVASSYLVGLQRASRQSVDTDLVITIRVPLVMDAAEAARLAEKHLKLSWVARNAADIAVGRKQIALDPTDIITVTAAGSEHRMRINQIKNSGGVLQLSCVDDDIAAYSSDVLGNVPADQFEGIDWHSRTIFEMIDGPVLSDSTDQLGIYVAATGVIKSWLGANLYRYKYRSIGGSTVWVAVANLVNNGQLGASTSILPTVPDPDIWDMGSSVNIFLTDPTDVLSSASEEEVLNGVNIALLGDEIIQWQTAVLESDGSYTISKLLRGRRATEWAMTGHVIGERFVSLDPAHIHFVPLSLNERNIERYYKGVTLGTAFADGLQRMFTYALNNMRIPSPVHIQGTRDASNNLTITWVRRTRAGGEWIDEFDVPQVEQSEQYVVVIYDTLDTYFTTSPTFEYTAAMQTADGLTPGDPVNVIVHQISSYFTEISVTQLIVLGLLDKWAGAATV